MKYRLKDKELQAKLDDLTNGAFSKNLHPYDETLFASYGDRQVLVEAVSGKRKHLEPKFGFWFTPDEIESIPQYDPHGWNEYPDVTPPEGVLMRVEAEGVRKFCGYYHTFAEGGCWCYEDGTVCPEAISKSVERFRPWED